MLFCNLHGRGNVSDIELFVDALEVSVDGLGRHLKFGGYRRGGEPYL
ncbi:hypothetical protein BDI4_830060 [Burkholderia diffusa]|nr:hypothetical protein BDI4_830060 [Burkholderia diffusa]